MTEEACSVAAGSDAAGTAGGSVAGDRSGRRPEGRAGGGRRANARPEALLYWLQVAEAKAGVAAEESLEGRRMRR